MRDVEYHPASLVATSECDPVCLEISIHEVGEIPIKVREAVGQVLPQALEHLAHALVEPRLDDLGGSLVFPLESLSALRNLVSQCGDLARDLVDCAGATVDAAEIALEFDRERRYHKLRSICPRLMQDMI